MRGDRSQCSDWLLIALQWAELAAPPMSVLGHTVVSSRGGERLYIRNVFYWCNPFVTGSLLFVAPVRRQAAVSSCGVVLCSPQVSAGCCFVLTVVSGLFLWLSLSRGWQLGAVDRMRTARAGMSQYLYALSESACLYAHRSSMTWTRIVSRMCWACMSDTRRRCWLKSCWGRDSQCVWVLIPDDDVGHWGFHDVCLFVCPSLNDVQVTSLVRSFWNVYSWCTLVPASGWNGRDAVAGLSYFRHDEPSVGTGRIARTLRTASKSGVSLGSYTLVVCSSSKQVARAGVCWRLKLFINHVNSYYYVFIYSLICHTRYHI